MDLSIWSLINSNSRLSFTYFNSGLGTISILQKLMLASNLTTDLDSTGLSKYAIVRRVFHSHTASTLARSMLITVQTNKSIIYSKEKYHLY